jgi:hypothetical protein
MVFPLLFRPLPIQTMDKTHIKGDDFFVSDRDLSWRFGSE